MAKTRVFSSKTYDFKMMNILNITEENHIHYLPTPLTGLSEESIEIGRI